MPSVPPIVVLYNISLLAKLHHCMCFVLSPSSTCMQYYCREHFLAEAQQRFLDSTCHWKNLHVHSVSVAVRHMHVPPTANPCILGRQIALSNRLCIAT